MLQIPLKLVFIVPEAYTEPSALLADWRNFMRRYGRRSTDASLRGSNVSPDLLDKSDITLLYVFMATSQFLLVLPFLLSSKYLTGSIKSKSAVAWIAVGCLDLCRQATAPPLPLTCPLVARPPRPCCSPLSTRVPRISSPRPPPPCSSPVCTSAPSISSPCPPPPCSSPLCTSAPMKSSLFPT